jgi:hypothetical protein
MRAAKVCSHVGPDGSCAELQPCPTHAPQPWQGSTRRQQLPPGWSHRIVPRILKRDPVCTDGVACGGRSLSTEVHHTRGPHDHSDEALAGVCHDCHAYRTGQQAAEGRRA